jgi:hypothetical protein
MITKKHFEEIALILAKNKASEKLIEDFIIYFEKENARFNPYVFKERILELKFESNENILR